MKPVRWLGDSLKCPRAFSDEARQDAGYQIGRLQRSFRVIHTARMAEAVFVLHAFQKKKQATSKSDIELAKIRLVALLEG